MISRTLHFIWTGRAFGRGEYAALLSALWNTSYEVVLHTDLEASGAPHDPFSIEHERLTVKKRQFPRSIEGVLLREANISDYVRLEILFEEGGMYSDLDILWLQEVDFDHAQRLVASWENPSYRTASNAWMAMERGHEAVPRTLEACRRALQALRAKGITDVTTTRHRRKHLLFFYICRDFLREHCDAILPKRTFFSNGWRRIARAFKRHDLRFPEERRLHVGSTEDDLKFDGITGFHYFHSFFPFDALASLPPVAEKFRVLLQASDVH
jgi:hypothetical protein